jgi:hypothetical protein
MTLTTRDIRFMALSLALGGLAVGMFRFADSNQTVPALIEKCWMGTENGFELQPYLQIGVFDGFHCFITQRIYHVAASTYGGTLSGLATFVALTPWLVFIALEAGRPGAKGLIRYPMIIACILQMGVGMLLLFVYIPSFIYGRSKERRPLSKAHILCSTIPALAYTAFAGLTLFTPANTTLWKVSTVILGGPGIVLSFAPLWLVSGGQPLEREESRRLATVPYILNGTIAFVLWLGVLSIFVFQMRADFQIVFEALWKDATPFVRFYVIDAISICVAALVLVGYLRESVLKECLGLSALFGPGSGVAMVLAGLEIDERAPDATVVASAEVEAKKKD